MLSYKFVRGKARLKKVKELPPPLGVVQQKDGTLAPAQFYVPTPPAGRALIPTLEVTEESEMLGTFYASASDGTRHLTEMRGKGFEWADRLTTRPLPRCDAWLSFFLQLFPGMVWGLETVMMPPPKMTDLMQKLYFRLLLKLDVNRHIAKEWRMLPERFHGLGLPNFVALSFAAKVYFLQRHFGFEDAVGEMMMQAFEAFVL